MAAEPVLDAKVVVRWCRAARDGLAQAREEIDALNVYPVPDGDTGTNLYLTVESATEAAESAFAEIPEASTGAVLQAAARGALLGARGNSGVIFSQMLRAVAEVLGRAEPAASAEPAAFAEALTRAADAGYAAVGSPVEGTILTVARAAAQAASASAGDDGATLADVALAAARAAHEALQRTPEQLDVLRRAGVVDAGGRGLTVVLDVFDTVLTGRRPLTYPATVTGVDVSNVVLDEQAKAAPAYEVMYLLDASEQAIPALRATLATLGDSLIVVGGDPLWNVHVHVDDAGAAIEAGLAAGRPHRIRVTHLGGPADNLTATVPTRAVVAFAAGPGLAALFESAGVTVVRTAIGRPSTAEILDAIRSTGASEVVVLPNTHDAIAVAEAAAAEARTGGVRVAVIPTRAQVQGLAAAAVHEPTRNFDADVVAMTTAAGHTRHGAVTVAVREAVTSAGVCRPGEVLGVVEGDFVVIGSDPAAVAVEVVERMLAAGGELVTVVTGADGGPDLADAVVEAVRRDHAGVDTLVYEGGQPRYPLLVGVE